VIREQQQGHDLGDVILELSVRESEANRAKCFGTERPAFNEGGGPAGAVLGCRCTESQHGTCPPAASASLAWVKALPWTSPQSTDETAAGIFAQDGLQRLRYWSGVSEAGVQRRAN